MDTLPISIVDGAFAEPIIQEETSSAPNAKESLQAADEETALVDRILKDYPPYNWFSHLVLRSGATANSENSSEAENVEKWLLVGFCSICILAMIVCIVVLIIYKVRKNRRQAELDSTDSLILPQSSSTTPTNSRQKQPRQGSKQRRQSSDSQPHA